MKNEELKMISATIDFDKCSKLLSDYLNVIYPHIEKLKNLSLNRFQYFLLSIFIRFSINTEAIIQLLPLFKKDGIFKVPIILIFRSIISDYFTIQYLLTFEDTDDKGNTAINNEIDVLNRDFVRFQKDFLLEELSYILKQNRSSEITQEKIKERLDSFCIKNIDFFQKLNGEFELKPIKSFRSTTNPKHFKDQNERSLAINDKNKYERLKSCKKDEFGFQAYLPYKYFSQFQHPSSNMDELIMSDPTLIDNRLILMSIDLIFVASIQIIQLTFNTNEPDQEIIKLKKELLSYIKR